VDVYFQPALIPITTTTTNCHHEADDAAPAKYQAAMLRGRGLLAKSDDHHPQVRGRVFEIQGDDNNELKEIMRFDKLIEWHHEHLTSAIEKKNNRVQTALDWMEVAQALHAPIPPNDCQK
jgi:hypothetical protein